MDSQQNKSIIAEAEELQQRVLNTEISAEKRINKLNLFLFGLSIPSILICKFTNIMPFFSKMTAVDLGGSLVFLIYNIILFILLSRNFYHHCIKYITNFLLITIVTVILAGYSINIDLVYSVRSVNVNVYYLIIFLSGLYFSPKLPIFSAVTILIQYGLLFAFSIISGFTQIGYIETFRQNIVTYDILIKNAFFFTIAGFIMFLFARHYKMLAQALHKSSVKLQQEIETRIESDKRARFYENYDNLTELPNFKFFKEKLSSEIEKAQARNQTFALMCLGLDNFKKVNQLYGTESGHKLLRMVSNKLKDTFRKDDFTSRYMGDKFLILFADIKNNYNISDLIRKSRSIFSSPFTVDDVDIKLSASAGLCSYPSDSLVADELIDKAELAMYRGKHQGKNIFQLFDLTMQEELDKKLVIERELVRAVSRSEFYTVFQPKVNLEGKIIGAEALLRWNSQELGEVYPGIFIPIAEQSGEIIPIGYYILHQVCSYIEYWDRLGIPPIPVTVNVSPHQFSQRDIVANINFMISKASISSDWIGIELTESSMMGNEEDCIDKLNDLKNLGITISIDDFGKGYSSLTRLGNYPLDTLKIDKSFVDGLPDSRISTNIVCSIIDLAHNLGYNVIAEGVEKIEQINFLHENGCDSFQGYYYYKPLLPDDFIKILTENKS